MVGGGLKRHYACRYPDCPNVHYRKSEETIKTRTKHFFSCPQNPMLNKIWRTNCRMHEPVKKFYICQDHFHDKDFTNANKHRLNYRAVPICYVEPAVEEDEDHTNLFVLSVPSSGYSQEEYSTMVNTQFSQLKEQMNETEALKKIKRLYKNVVSATKNTSSDTEEVIKSKLVKADKTDIRKWSNDARAHSLLMYKRTPKIFNFFQEFFQLPDAPSLDRILMKLNFQTGVNEEMFVKLKEVVDSKPVKERYCNLLFHRINLQENRTDFDPVNENFIGFEDLGHLGRKDKMATQGVVFMARGINSPWKQVVSYYLISEETYVNELKELIVYNIKKLQDVSLIVTAAVCEYDELNHIIMANLCSIHQEKKSYSFLVNNNPISVFYNVPHLLKSTRDALIQCNIMFDTDMTANFDHIHAAYKSDSQSNCKLFYMLNDEVFNFENEFLNSKTCLAEAQLSYKMAALIEAKIPHTLPNEALQTAHFVAYVEQLYDSLTSSKTGEEVEEHRPYNCILTNRSPHLKLWAKILGEIDDWAFIDKTTEENVTSRYNYLIETWKFNIRSVTSLWKYIILNNLGFDSINMGNFTLDPLENLFAIIRGSPNNVPSPKELIDGLKISIIDGLKFDENKIESCCEPDNCTMLYNFSSFIPDFEEN